MVESDWPPPPWPVRKLEEDARTSLLALNEAQEDVSVRRSVYAAFFDQGVELFNELMSRSDNMLGLTGSSFNSNRQLVAMGRFTGGPMISHDDLERLVGRGLANKTISDHLATSAAAAIVRLIDPRRFPWVSQQRRPDTDELSQARTATATLWAMQRTQTGERGQARLLEDEVKNELARSGLVQVKRPPKGLPWTLGPGQFCGEGPVAGTNCDVIAHLQAHQKALLIECKVSGTHVNGSKRLKSIKDAATDWRRALGEQVLPVGVIKGAFNIPDILAAQRGGVCIVWQHDLSPLRQFIQSWSQSFTG